MGAAGVGCDRCYVVDTPERRRIESPEHVSHSPDEKPHVPAPSLWPIGFAIGIACALVGLIVSVPVLIVGAALTLLFGWLWVRDLFRVHGPAPSEPGIEEEPEAEIPAYPRSVFLAASTLGIGGLIGGIVTLPVLGFAVLPSFEDQGSEDIDLGPLSNFPEGKYVIATYIENPSQGDVSRRTAYVRNNGATQDGVPSFTILFSRCVHLGCPVQANGPMEGDPVSYRPKAKPEVTLQPVLAASFGCPCHGGQYDAEGNRTAGPPVRALDRYRYRIDNGRLILISAYSVGKVEGAAADAKIKAYDRVDPSVHVDGPEQIFYPLEPPR
jgi:Rieske Fe-S protein